MCWSVPVQVTAHECSMGSALYCIEYLFGQCVQSSCEDWPDSAIRPLSAEDIHAVE